MKKTCVQSDGYYIDTYIRTWTYNQALGPFFPLAFLLWELPHTPQATSGLVLRPIISNITKSIINNIMTTIITIIRISHDQGYPWYTIYLEVTVKFVIRECMVLRLLLGLERQYVVRADDEEH